jgi:hypothetical protein
MYWTTRIVMYDEGNWGGWQSYNTNNTVAGDTNVFFYLALLSNGGIPCWCPGRE